MHVRDFSKYRDFKKVTSINFQSELVRKLISCSLDEHYTFQKSFVEVLDKHTPKKKILRGNQKSQVNKTLRSAIMKRSQLKNRAMKSNSKNNIIEYKNQRNIVVKLNTRCKK